MFKVTIKRGLALKFKDLEEAAEYKNLLNVFIPKGDIDISYEGDESTFLIIYDADGRSVGYISEIEGYNNEKL